MNTNRGILFLTATLMLLPLQARFVAADREHQQIMADVRMLQEQAQQLAIAVSRLAEALKRIDEHMDRQAEANLKAFASQRLLADNISSNLQVIRERADETKKEERKTGEEGGISLNGEKRGSLLLRSLV